MSEAKQIERAVSTNPDRKPGIFEDYEREVSEMAKAKTPQTMEVYSVEHHQYWAPFNYPNARVELGRTELGAEFNPDGVELDVPPWGAITIEEEKPIIAVTVIGSACAPPGYVMLHAEPLEWKYPRTGVRLMVDNLWGEHINAYPWFQGVTEQWREAGLSSAHFEIPESRKVTIMGGSQAVVGGREIEHGANDGHYCVRIIRVTVKSD
mgnify:CR=1 FL=1